MNNKEIIKLISEATNLNWFNSINETIFYKHIELSQTFTTVSALHNYLLDQVNGWQKLENLPNEFIQSMANFKRTLEQIEHFVTYFSKGSNNELDSQWIHQIKQNLHTIQSPPNFPFDCPETEFLLELYNKNLLYYTPAYQYITGSVDNLMNSHNLKGALLAYEFTTRGKTEISLRRKKEEQSLNHLKSEFREYISSASKHLSEHLSEAEKKYNDYTIEIDKYKTTKELEVNSWHENNRKAFEELKDTSTQKITDLEKAYDELLRLKKPAEYWKLRAEKLNKEGKLALKWLIIVIAFACVSLYFLLWLTPDGMLLSFIKGSTSALKWSIVYITFISFLAVGIRALSKVMFSSFHLSRDAEEREQLSYFYLALIKDSVIDEKDKHLIMQSLFSRSDTGLLKEDSSPTMPGGFIDKLVQK